MPPPPPSTVVNEIGGVLQSVLKNLLAIEVSRAKPFPRPTPFAVTYALPVAYVGAAPNSAYGIPESQTLLTLPYVLFVPGGASEAQRGVELQRAETRANYVRGLAAQLPQLPDAEIVSRLQQLQRTPIGTAQSEVNTQLALAEEIRRRGLAGPLPGLPAPGQATTVEQLLARAPQPVAQLTFTPAAAPVAGLTVDSATVPTPTAQLTPGALVARQAAYVARRRALLTTRSSSSTLSARIAEAANQAVGQAAILNGQNPPDP